jgi:protein involved in polysaccharide export with SLBB domain
MFFLTLRKMTFFRHLAAFVSMLTIVCAAAQPVAVAPASTVAVSSGPAASLPVTSNNGVSGSTFGSSVSASGQGAQNASGMPTNAGINPSQQTGLPASAGAPAGANSLTSSKVSKSNADSPLKSTDPSSDEQGADQDSAKDKSAQAKSEAIKDVEQTEFQRFVFENTGKALGLYGYSLFSQPSSYAPILAAPVPNTYVLGPGDELVLQTYGIVNEALRLVIDRNGMVSLPKVGMVRLAGMPFSEAEKVLHAQVSKIYVNYTLSLTMGRLRSIEIFVLGQAAKPGKHVVSGLSSLINAVLETGGPSANGSLRQIELRRGGKTVTQVDMYKFLSTADNSSDALLQSGDVIYIPPAGARAAVLGTVHAPAIYELLQGETIMDVLQLSGGLPVLANPQKAQLDRVDPTQAVARSVVDFALDAEGLKRQLKAGDVLTVFKVSPQIGGVVTLQGNVAAPLRYSHKLGMKVSDVLGDPRLLIPAGYWLSINAGANSGVPNRPEVNLDYATIQRLDPKALVTRVMAFSPIKAMSGDPRENIELQPGDIMTVYAPGQAGPETDASIAIKGEIVGGFKRFVWREGMTFKDIIPSTQWLIDYYQYWQKSSGQSIRNDINWDYAQVVRRDPQNLKTQSFEFNLGQQILRDSKDPAFKPLALQAGDEITLFTTAELPVPIEKRTQFVRINGEVQVPGIYQIRPGETLPELVKRAGGLSSNAYLYGTVFTRESTRAQQQANLDQAIRKMEASISSQLINTAQNTLDPTVQQNQMSAMQATLAKIKTLKPSGRIALELDPEQPVLPVLTLEDGDTVSIPPKAGFVSVFGAVHAESTFIHKVGNTVADYLDKAGPNREADLEATLLVRSDGTIVGNKAQRSWVGWGNSSFMNSNVYPGDSVYVPELLDRRTPYTIFMQSLKDWSQVLLGFGVSIAALHAVGM